MIPADVIAALDALREAVLAPCARSPEGAAVYHDAIRRARVRLDLAFAANP